MRKNIYLLIGLLCVSFLAFGKNFSDNILRLGTGGSAVDTEIISNQPGTNDPYQKYDQAQDKWVFSNDGVTEKAIGSGSGGGGGENFNNGFTEDDNANAEDGLTGWTASAGTFAINDSDPLELIQSFEWTPSAQNDTLDSAVLNFDRDIFKGRACEGRIEYIGGDENLTLQVIDADNDVIAEQVLETHNVSGVQSAFFLCPSSGATANDLDLRLRILNEGATASPIIKFDKSYVGTLIGLEVSAEVGTPGQIITTSDDVCPSGTLEADGSQVSRAIYADLYAAIGDSHGNGDGSTTFHIPDYRGRFLRGHANGNTRDVDRAIRTAMNAGGLTGDNVGSVQDDAIREMVGQFDTSFGSNGVIYSPATTGVFENLNSGRCNGAISCSGPNDRTSTLRFRASKYTQTGGDNRPDNAAVKFCVRTVSVSQQVYKSVPKVSENINSFSAEVSSLAAVLKENTDFIDGDCTEVSTGIYDCPYVSGIFTNAPSCVVSDTNGGGTGNSVKCSQDIINSDNTLLKVRCINTNSFSVASRSFSFTCDKVGSDFKMPIVQPIVVGGGSTVEIEDDGSSLTTEVKKINFTGAGVTVTEPSADEIEVNVGGGGGGGNYAISADSGGYSVPNASYNDVPNQSVSITTTGGAVMVSFVAGNVQFSRTYGDSNCRLRAIRDATEIGIYLNNTNSNVITGTSFSFVDIPPAGTYTYKIQAAKISGSDCIIYGYKTFVHEI